MKKNKTPIIITAITVIVLGGLIWLGRPQNSPNTTAGLDNGILETEEKFYDFGDISMAKGKVSHSFKIKNSGSSQVQIDQINTSCMCTEATFFKDSQRFGPFGMPGHGFAPSLNISMEPREEATMEVVFDPNAHGPAGVGKIERQVLIGGKDSSLILNISANVTP